MRHIKIGLYLKVTLVYRGLKCKGADNMIV